MRAPFTPLVESLPSTIPFTGPETLERRRSQIFQARLGANESAFGMSPKASAAIAQACAHGAWYGDPECWDLRHRLARHHRVDPSEICIAAGIDELLGLAVRLVCQNGSVCVTSNGAYPTLNYHIAGFGGQKLALPYKNDHEDPEALARAARDHEAVLVYLANPDNPMGGWHDAAIVSSFLRDLPNNVLILLDEAYAEFAPSSAIPEIDTSDPRVLRLRTFSKAHGLAGLRIGYTIAHKGLIQALGKIRNHFAVNRLAQAAAMASLDDPDFIGSVIQAVDEGRKHYSDLALKWGFKPLPSATNFVAIDVGSPERAKSLLVQLEERGVFIRMPGVAPLNRCIRISVGTPAERQILDQAMTTILA